MYPRYHGNHSDIQSFSRTKYYGSVFLNTPWHYSALGIGAVFLLIAILLLITFGGFSEKYTVSGFLSSNKGLAQIFPKQAGVIVKRYVTQGLQVERGAPLFLIETSLNETTSTQLIAQMRQKKELLIQALTHKKQMLSTLKDLLRKKFISITTYQTKLDEIFDLKQQLHQLNIELLKLKQDHSYVLRAPVSGQLTSVLSEPGQTITPTHAIANILPKNAQFIAELFIPINKIAFIQPGDDVALHYDAYPYQHFGSPSGKILNISRNSFTDKDENKPVHVGQPYYKAQALLNEQLIKINDKNHPLQLGMTFSAILTGQHKKIWQWIFEPLIRA